MTAERLPVDSRIASDFTRRCQQGRRIAALGLGSVSASCIGDPPLTATECAACSFGLRAIVRRDLDCEVLFITSVHGRQVQLSACVNAQNPRVASTSTSSSEFSLLRHRRPTWPCSSLSRSTGTLALYLWALFHANAASEAEKARIYSPVGLFRGAILKPCEVFVPGVVDSIPLPVISKNFRPKIAILSSMRLRRVPWARPSVLLLLMLAGAEMYLNSAAQDSVSPTLPLGRYQQLYNADD